MSIYKLLIQLIGQDKGATATMKKASGAADELEDNISGASSAIGRFLGPMALAGIVIGAGKAAWELGELGAQSLRLETALDNLAAQAGGSSEAILDAIKRASGGTVSEMDAIAAANKGILLGLGAQADQWEQLAEVARFRARAMGLTMTQALGDITTAIGRESKMIADNLGIIWDMDQIMTNYAATLGKTATELTSVERKAALMADTIRIGQEQIAASGMDGIGDDAADSFERLDASVKNLKTSLGELTLPVIGPAVEALYALSEAAQGNIKPFNELNTKTQMAGKKVNEAGEIFVRTASGTYILSEALTLSSQAIQDNRDQADGWLRTYSAWVPQIQANAAALHTFLDSIHLVSDATVQAQTTTYAAARAFDESVDPLRLMAGVAETAASIIDHEYNAAIRDGIKVNLGFADSATTAARSVESAYSKIQSAVSAALTGTSVTGLDMGMTGLGLYVDKWDEDARRLDAIAARGFAELDAHPDWAAMLKIPPDVLAAGEQALKSWASQTSSDVRNLFRPDLLVDNMDAAVKAVENYLQQQAQRETTISMVTEAYLAKHKGADPEQAKQMVEGLLGDPEAIGMNIGDALTGGLTSAMGQASVVAAFDKQLGDDINDNRGALTESGKTMWAVIERGMKDQMLVTDWPKEIAARVAPYVVSWLVEHGII